MRQAGEDPQGAPKVHRLHSMDGRGKWESDKLTFLGSALLDLALAALRGSFLRHVD